jgi:hypothetical protein
MTEDKARETLLQLLNAAVDGDGELIASWNLPRALEQLVGKTAALRKEIAALEALVIRRTNEETGLEGLLLEQLQRVPG